jgi:transcription elongation factor Elf1
VRGRRKPYSAIGISRIPCARCGKPSTQQWSICSNGNRYLGVCTECDIRLNVLVLKFFRFKNISRMIRQYAKRFLITPGN